jgi:hypothetical protein
MGPPVERAHKPRNSGESAIITPHFVIAEATKYASEFVLGR